MRSSSDVPRTRAPHRRCRIEVQGLRSGEFFGEPVRDGALPYVGPAHHRNLRQPGPCATLAATCPFLRRRRCGRRRWHWCGWVGHRHGRPAPRGSCRGVHRPSQGKAGQQGQKASCRVDGGHQGDSSLLGRCVSEVRSGWGGEQRGRHRRGKLPRRALGVKERDALFRIYNACRGACSAAC